MSTTSATAPTEQERSPRAVVRQSGITSAVAMLGVFSGLLLDLAWTSVFGLGKESDAWVLALRVPLSVTAIAMVVANQVLVPTFAAWSTRLEQREQARAQSAVLLAVSGFAIALATLLTVFARPIVAGIAPGFAEVPGKLELAATMTQIIAWYIPCVLMAEVLRCWLNAHLVVGFPAAMTLVLNLVAGVLILAFAHGNEHMVPLAYVAGSMVQVLAMAGMALAKGWRPALPDFRHPEVTHTFRLFGRPTAGAALNPVVRILEVGIASGLPQTSTTLLHFGTRLAAAVGGTVVFRSVIVSVLPRISRAYGRADIAAFRTMTRLGLRLMFLLSVPMTILGVVLAPGLTDLVFSLVPKFGERQVQLLGVLLALYSLSFIGAGVQRALLAPFYAMRDTKTPWRNVLYGMLANVVLLLLGARLLDSSAESIYLFPVAYSLAQCVNVAHAWWCMRRVPGLERMPLLVPLAGSLASGFAGAGVALLILRLAPTDPPFLRPVLATLVGLGIACGAGFLAFRRGSRGSGAAPLTAHPGDGDIPTALTLAAGEQEDIHVTTTTQRPAPRPPAHASAPTGPLTPTNVVTALLGIALTAWTVLGLTNGTSRISVALPIAVIVGVALLLIAFYDLETFVLVALAVRSSLDALRTPGAAPDPHMLLGILMLALGGLWLITRKARLGRQIPVSALGLAYLAFLLIAFLGVITSPNTSTAITEWSRIANIVVIFLVVEQFAARGSRLQPFVASMGLAILVPAAVALVQLSSGEGLFVAGGFSRITGTFDHSNPLAYFSVIVLLLMVAVYPAVHDLSRVAVGALGLVALLMLGLTYTRSAWLVALLGVLLLLARRKAYALVAVIFALSVIAASTPQVQGRFADLESSAQISGKPANSLAWRWAYWGESLDVAKPSPIAGVGLRTVATTTSEGKQPHNDVIRSYVELGIPGLLSYLFVLILMVWTSARGAADAARRGLRGFERAIAEAGLVVALSVAVLSLVANLMSQAVVTLYAVSMIALASGGFVRRRRLDAEADAAADELARSVRITRT